MQRLKNIVLWELKMMQKLRFYWKIFWLFRAQRLQQLLEYRNDFIFWSLISIFWTVFNIFFFTLLVDVSGTIGSWNKSELYVLLGIFTSLDAFTWSFLYRNMRLYTLAVFEGSLDLFLTKPIDTQFLLSVQDNSYTNVPRLLLGPIIIWYGFSQLGHFPSFVDILGMLFTFAAGILLFYCLWFIIATCCLWVDRLENVNEIAPGLRRIFQVPRTIYTGFLSSLLTVVVPLGLVTSVPTEILLGKNSYLAGFYLLVSSILFLLISRVFFTFSLKKYSSVGS